MDFANRVIRRSAYFAFLKLTLHLRPRPNQALGRLLISLLYVFAKTLEKFLEGVEVSSPTQAGTNLYSPSAGHVGFEALVEP